MNQPIQLVSSAKNMHMVLKEMACWVFFALVWFGPLGFRDLIHPDEGRYAMLSLGMLQSGDWVTPRLNGVLYFEKPPLQYWAGALSFMLFGVNDFAARLWPALTGFGAVIMVAFTANRLWGSQVGRLAAIVMGSTTWVIGNSHFLTLDMGLTFFLTVALCGFLLAQRSDVTVSGRRYGMWVTWAAMAAATLSKGLVGLVIPGATLVIYSVWNRQWGFWARMHWFSGFAIYLMCTVPWMVLVSLKNPGFASFFFIHEHFDRFLTTGHRRLGPIWYFIPCLIVGLLPWTTLIVPLLRKYSAYNVTKNFQLERLLLVWIVFVFVFFSVSSSKLPSYILPMFPALALLIAHYLSQIEDGRALKIHLILPAMVWLFILASLPFSAYFVSPDIPPESVQSFAQFIVVAAVVFLMSTLLAWMQLGRGHVMLAVMMLAMGNLLAVTVMMNGHDNYGRLFKSSRDIVTKLQNQLPPDIPFYSVRYYDQTLPFYLRRPVILVDFIDEFAYGETQEPIRWIPSLSEFALRWKTIPNAAAMMAPDTYSRLSKMGLPMRVLYQDTMRLVVIKQ